MDVTATGQPTIDPLPPPKAVNKGEELPSGEVKSSRPAPVFAPTREAPSPGDDAPHDMTNVSASSLANDNMLPGLSTAVSADDSPSLKQQCAPCTSIFPIVADGVHQPSSASSNTAAIRSESGAPHPNANNETSSICSSHSSEESAVDKIHTHVGGAVASWGGQISPPVVRDLAQMVHHTTIAEAAVAPKCTMMNNLSLSMMERAKKHIHGESAASAFSIGTNAESKAQEIMPQAKKREAEEVAGEEVTEPCKKKKAKDPNAPVRPKTGYMFYSCNGARTLAKMANPNLTFEEVIKVVAASWNAMSDEKKAVWNRMAAEDVVRYQREMDAYKNLNCIAPEEAKLLEEAVLNTEAEMEARGDCTQYGAPLTYVSPEQSGTPHPPIAAGADAFPMPPLGHNVEYAVNDDRETYLLATAKDSDSLSDRQCYVRSHLLEVFVANKADMAARPSRGGLKVNENQIGLRCAYCVKLQPKDRATRAVCYPSSINRIYNSVADMQRSHFEKCTAIPPKVLATYKSLKTTRPRSVGGSQGYWDLSARNIGLVDSSSGIQVGEDGGMEQLLMQKKGSTGLLESATAIIQPADDMAMSSPVLTSLGVDKEEQVAPETATSDVNILLMLKKTTVNTTNDAENESEQHCSCLGQTK